MMMQARSLEYSGVFANWVMSAEPDNARKLMILRSWCKSGSRVDTAAPLAVITTVKSYVVNPPIKLFDYGLVVFSPSLSRVALDPS